MSVKVLHFSTHHENCGIGKYQEMFLDAMQSNGGVQNDFFDTSPNKIREMDDTNKHAEFKKMAHELKDFDILHIQHEFSFYKSDEFTLACETAAKAHKKLIVTVHTSPTVVFTKPVLRGRGPRSILHFLRQKKRYNFFIENFINPLKKADLVLVHNHVTKQALIGEGVRADAIQEIVIPVPKIDTSFQSTEIAEKLNKRDGDIVFATTGFLHKFKGVDHAIKALKYLPENYKLAIVGGMHQDHDNQIYNDLTDLILELDLRDRVYITGYVKDDNKLNALIRECDICVYPYEKVYYSNVSSAALNNAFANGRPVIGYPTASFRQLNDETDYLVLTQAFSYYELAREIGRLDRAYAADMSQKFLETFSYQKVADELVGIYEKV